VNLRERLERAASAGEPQAARASALRFHGVRVGLALALALFTYLLFPSSPAVDVPIYEVGAVARDNVIAPFAFAVPKSSSELAAERAALEGAAPPIYRFDPRALDSARALLRGFTADVEGVSRGAPAPAAAIVPIQQIASRWEVRLLPQEAAYLAQGARREALVFSVARVFDRWLGAGVAATAALDSVRGDVILRRGQGSQRLTADSLATFTTLVTRARLVHPDPGSPVADAVYLKLLAQFFRPTIVPDPSATELRREELVRTVRPNKYEVKAGEKIIGAAEVVGRDEHEKLRALHDQLEARRGPERGFQRLGGAILLDFLLLALLGTALALYWPATYRDLRALTVIALLVVAVIGAAGASSRLQPIRPELVPVALAGVVLSALFDQRLSAVAVTILATLAGVQSAFRGTNALYLALVGGLVAALSVRAIHSRNQAYRWILTTAGAYVLASLAIGLALDQPLGSIAATAGWGSLGALASVLLAIFLLPLAEQFTGRETDLTLLEWSDLNRPLMQQLSREAPGTYAHTMVLAQLAESACRAIGANPILARVGAYYHDIGKLARPQYFVENQAKGRNPHDKLKPGTSASIIRNHVKEGLQLAESHRLPRAIRAFITEHHGTASISYFLEKAKERDGPVANPGEYAYPGPVPQSAETAVVMLADGVEASVRVLSEPTRERVREVVEHIVRQRIEQGQLREAPLTLRQIEIVKEEFTRVLAGMYHNRVDYPASSGGVTSEFASV
jgi:putative nucleotidyltransferase with HDIG domain